MVHQVTSEEDFQTQLETATGLVVVDCFANWCGPCKAIAPAFADLHTVYPDVTYLKLNVDDEDDLAEDLEISSLPTFLFYHRGVQLHKMLGANLEKLVNTIRDLRDQLQNVTDVTDPANVAEQVVEQVVEQVAEEKKVVDESTVASTEVVTQEESA